MDLTTDLKVGQIVKSKSGRDKGRVFLVSEIVDENNVLIVDGKLRGIERPKLKKIKHLMVYKEVLDQWIIEGDPPLDNNARIRKCLNPFK